MNAQEIVDYIFSIAPNPKWATENVFEFGDGQTEVSAIGVAWWITSDMLRDFTNKGINLGLTHETVTYPVDPNYLWGATPSFEEIVANKKVTLLANANDITIHRFHSNIDVADWGMPKVLIRQLGWQDQPADWSRGVPVIDIPPMSLGDLLDHVKSSLSLPFVRYDGDLSRTIRRVAIPWGGLCQWFNGVLCAAPLGFDALIGGDIIDGVVRLAREYGWCTIDAMHHSTELGAMQLLSEKLREAFPEVEVHYYENSMPWAVRV